MDCLCNCSGDSLLSERDQENSVGGEREGSVGESESHLLIFIAY